MASMEKDMDKKHDLVDLAYKYMRVVVLLLVAVDRVVDLVSKVVNYARSVLQFRLLISPEREACICS
jgi:hypothetical protein